MTAPKPRYTTTQKAHAVQHAATHGVEATARAIGAKPDTIRRWCADANVQPADGRRKTVARKLVDKVTDGTIDAAAARAERVAETQRNLRDVAGTQSTLVLQHQKASMTAILRVNDYYQRLVAAEQRAADLPADAPLAARARAANAVQAAAQRLDAEIARASALAKAAGVHLDRILRLSGETAEAAAQGAAAANVQTAVGHLLADPEMRAAVLEKLAKATVPRRLQVVDGGLP